MKALSPLHQEVLKKYAQTLPGGQYTLAKNLNVHFVTLSRWLNNRGCSEYEACTDMARQLLLRHPEWSDSVEAGLMQKAMKRLNCTRPQAKIIASVLLAS